MLVTGSNVICLFFVSKELETQRGSINLFMTDSGMAPIHLTAVVLKDSLLNFDCDCDHQGSRAY